MISRQTARVTPQTDTRPMQQAQHVSPYIGGGVLDDAPRRPSPWVPDDISGADVPRLTWRQQYRLLRTLREDAAFRRDFVAALGLEGGAR